MQSQPLYRHLAQCIGAHKRCQEPSFLGDPRWKTLHWKRAKALVREFLPSGCGIDVPVTFDVDKTTPERFVFVVEFHHMNDAGYYDGWGTYIVYVTPSLETEINLRITGNDIPRYAESTKDMLAEQFHYALTVEHSDEKINAVYKKVDEANGVEYAP